MSAETEQWLRDHNIDEVEGIVPDMAGVARGKFVPAEKFFSSQGMRLPESVFTQTVTGEYIEFNSDLDWDMELSPDLNTFRIVPWASEPTACVIQDCFDRDGKPVEIAPRTVLKKVLDLYAAKGWEVAAAPEVEFYLVKKNIDPDQPLEPPVGRSGRQETVRQPYSIDAVNEFDPLFEEMFDFCESLDIGADSLIHEGGAAQVEINFLHGNPLDLADQVFLFKRCAREVALRHGVYATFMAKPMATEPGSALHIHQSVVDRETGKNIFANDEGEESDLFRHFIAGLQNYVPKTLPLFAPYVNSYRRFTSELAAPINVQWGYDNRTVGLRVPRSGPANRRVENRVAGADVNPYLAMAATLACGYIGLTEGREPTDALETSAYNLPPDLSRDMFYALDMLSKCEPVQDILSEAFIQVYCDIKHEEHETFFQVISPWEREFLLLNV